jgi:hypothetical protein
MVLPPFDQLEDDGKDHDEGHPHRNPGAGHGGPSHALAACGLDLNELDDQDRLAHDDADHRRPHPDGRTHKADKPWF